MEKGYLCCPLEKTKPYIPDPKIYKANEGNSMNELKYKKAWQIAEMCLEKKSFSIDTANYQAYSILDSCLRYSYFNLALPEHVLELELKELTNSVLKANKEYLEHIEDLEKVNKLIAKELLCIE